MKAILGRGPCAAILALGLAVSLASCGPKPEAAGPAVSPAEPSGAQSPFAGLGPAEQQALAVALMRAQFAVGRKLVELEAREAAAEHFRRPMDEIFRDYSDLFTEVRVTPPEAPFVALTEAANAERDPGQLQPLYQPAQAAMDELEPRGGYDRVAVLGGVLKELRAAYAQAVENTQVSNRVALEDAYGLVVVARQMVDFIEADATVTAELRTEIDRLAGLVQGPVPSATPTLPGAVAAQISRLEVTLAGIS